ncbi:hypothetical protein RI129_001240 [Pyrocoelia pectoralis]|uniref:Bromodomain associated domain-containing protein n=1 Tax=Pyrocoelia pectoralis TaxID=417401 RepID=A0AAN7ZX24_9COLE
MEPFFKKHWGEIDKEDYSVSNDSFFPDVSVDIERSMNKFCLAEFDSDYHDTRFQDDEIILDSMDPMMMYAITLHKYANNMNEMIRVAELAIESGLIPPADVVPPIPTMPEVQNKHARNCLNFIPKEFTPFSLGEAEMSPEISSAVVKQILTKSIATMFAHVGYETTHSSVLNILVDVLSAFLKKIIYHLKIAQEDRENGQIDGFPNIVERVFVELGMGGVKGLHDYYQTRVVKYINVLQKRCKELIKHYESLLIRKTPSPDSKENKIIRVNVEEDEDVIKIDNPQVHLAIDGDVGFSTLDAGFQLLSSLEAGTSSQGLTENEEDTSITISPGVVSIPETELVTALSPFIKKKRSK